MKIFTELTTLETQTTTGGKCLCSCNNNPEPGFLLIGSVSSKRICNRQCQGYSNANCPNLGITMTESESWSEPSSGSGYGSGSGSGADISRLWQ